MSKPENVREMELFGRPKAVGPLCQGCALFDVMAPAGEARGMTI